MANKRGGSDQNGGEEPMELQGEAELSMEERVRQMIMDELRENLEPIRDRLMQEEAVRRELREHLGRQVERTVDLERQLERRLDGPPSVDREMLAKQREALGRLAQSLQGPQELLERAGPQRGDTGVQVGRVSRPPFNQPEARWSLPRLHEQKHDRAR